MNLCFEIPALHHTVHTSNFTFTITSIRLPLPQGTKIFRSNMPTIRKDHPIFKYLGPVRTIGSASLQTSTSQIFFTMFEEGVHNSRQADGALGLPTYVFKYRHRIYYR
jgi:hypothetical protein